VAWARHQQRAGGVAIFLLGPEGLFTLLPFSTLPNFGKVAKKVATFSLLPNFGNYTRNPAKIW
jgi:hypothetical protein